jgi:hypothetical protein
MASPGFGGSTVTEIKPDHLLDQENADSSDLMGQRRGGPHSDGNEVTSAPAGRV